MARRYYSQRNLQNPQLSLDFLREMLLQIYLEFAGKDFFYENFGFESGQGYTGYGIHGSNLDGYSYRKLRKKLWPIEEKIHDYDESDVFDVIEFLHDHISMPKRYERLYEDEFDVEQGQELFRGEINELLQDYGVGFELDESGNIKSLPDSGMEHLVYATIPSAEGVAGDVPQRMDKAVQKFREKGSSLEDRKAVILELVAIFEELKKTKKMKAVLNDKDESLIFELANKFAIRHAGPEQAKNYDKDIWYSWMFYYYLATLHATLRLIERRNKSVGAVTDQTAQGDIEKWQQVLSEIKRRNNTLYGLLRMANVSTSGDKIVLEFKFQFHVKRVAESKNLQLINAVTKEVFGDTATAEVKLSKITA